MNEDDRRLLRRLGEEQMEHSKQRTGHKPRPSMAYPNGTGLSPRPSISPPASDGFVDYYADQVDRLVAAGLLCVDRVTNSEEFFSQVTEEGLAAAGLSAAES